MLPPHVIYRKGKIGAAAFANVCDEPGQRLDVLWTTTPIAFRKQNSGNYRIPQLALLPVLAQGEAGFGIHVSHLEDNELSEHRVTGEQSDLLHTEQTR